MAKSGFTTAILHADREAAIEHGSLHKPLHLSVAYGYRDARELAAVFQGKAQGYAYGRQGNPTAAALEAKVNRHGSGRRDRLLRHRDGGRRRDHARAASRGRPCRLQFAFSSATRTACSTRWPSTAAKSRSSTRPMRVRSRRRCGRTRGSSSSRPSRTRARRSPTSRASASCARSADSSTSSTTR